MTGSLVTSWEKPVSPGWHDPLGTSPSSSQPHFSSWNSIFCGFSGTVHQSTHFRDHSSSHSSPSFPSTHKTNSGVFSFKQANKLPFSGSNLLLSGLLGYRRCSLLQHYSKIIHRWVWPQIHYDLATDTENKRLEALIAFWWIENMATESKNKKQACILCII